MLSSSWTMRAVAPQIISPSTSKNHTGNELSALPGISRAGNAPPLLVEDVRVGQIAQGHVEDPLHLGRAGHQVGPGGDGTQNGMMSEPETMVSTGWIHPSVVTCGRIERHLLVGLAQGRRRGVFARVEPAPGEADLSPVRAQGRGAPGEHQAGLAGLLEEHGQHGGVDETDSRARSSRSTMGRARAPFRRRCPREPAPLDLGRPGPGPPGRGRSPARSAASRRGPGRRFPGRQVLGRGIT